MSTLLLAASPGDSLEKLDTSGVSAGSGMQTSSVVELQVNQATSAVYDGTYTGSPPATRQIQKEEVLLILNIFEQWITRHNWPYAAS